MKLKDWLLCCGFIGAMYGIIMVPIFATYNEIVLMQIAGVIGFIGTAIFVPIITWNTLDMIFKG